MPILLAFLLFMVPAPLLAQELPSAGSADRSSITVNGQASVERRPDQAVIQLAVESFNQNAQTASAENASRMDAVMKALRRLGLGEGQLRTLGFNLTPEYDNSSSTPRRSGEDRLVGYRARNTIQVTTNDIEQVGKIIDVAITAGVDRVARLTFQLQDPEEARQEALRLAIAKARAEAETIASALGRTLGPATYASTTGYYSPPMVRQESVVLRAANTAAPPIEPGFTEISAQVSLIFEMGPAR